MWAKKSSGVADARKLASPAVDVRGVITSTDAAKIQLINENENLNGNFFLTAAYLAEQSTTFLEYTKKRKDPNEWRRQL